MPETLKMTQEPIPAAEAVDDMDISKAEKFLNEVAPELGRMFGLPLHIKIGQGWATDLESGEVMADPNFFVERGYIEDWAVYATLHEVVAHLDEVVTKPELTRKVINFVKKSQAEGIFHNIFADIAGNNRVHAVLPSQANIASEMYSKRQFPDPDPEGGRISELPRHLQFLYSVIRTEMIPGSVTIVDTDVRSAIEGLRNYHGTGEDLIKHSTEAGNGVSPEERFTIWVNLIYPVYEHLLEKDKDNGGEGASKESSPFKQHYDDYFENKHPEPFSPEEHDKLHQHVHEKSKRQQSPEQKLDEQLKQETGFGLKTKQNYDRLVEQYLSAINEMRDVFASVIQQRLTIKKGLSRRPKTQGVMLDPNNLAQTAIDIKAGVEEPAAFLDFESQKRSGESVGKTDWVFIFDASGSMFFEGGEKAKAAEATAVICVEGLRAMQRDVEDAEIANNIDLDLDIRTAVYTFGDDAHEIKPLSKNLTNKQRYEITSAIQTSSGETADYLALQAVAELPEAKDRRRIVVVVSDGESNDSSQAKTQIDTLRQNSWDVIGISVGSDEAEKLYQPHAKRTDDPNDLPSILQKLINTSYAPTK